MFEDGVEPTYVATITRLPTRAEKWCVVFEGEKIVESSADPERDACLWFYARQMGGILETRRYPNGIPCLRLDIKMIAERYFERTKPDEAE